MRSRLDAIHYKRVELASCNEGTKLHKLKSEKIALWESMTDAEYEAWVLADRAKFAPTLDRLVKEVKQKTRR